MSGKVLVAGIGNIFRGDDAFGVEIVNRLSSRQMPGNVTIKDFGIRGFDLAYSLMERWELVILVDALPRGGTPGTLYVLEVGEVEQPSSREIETHGMTPLRALELVRSLGGSPPPTIVVGCEPGDLGGEEGTMGLSPAVASSVEEAICLIQDRASAFSMR